MKKANSSTPAKAAAARANGRKGGTKNPDKSRWNAVRHGLNANKLLGEAKHLPEHGEYVAILAELMESLGPHLLVEDRIAADKFVGDALRLRRAYRFEVSETEKAGNGMTSAATPNVVRYMHAADRQFDASYRRIKEIRRRRAPTVGGLSGNQQTTSAPPAVDAFSQPASVNEPRQSGMPASSPSSGPGNGADHTPEEVVNSAAAAEAAQPAQSPATATPATAVGEEEKVDSPGAG